VFCCDEKLRPGRALSQEWSEGKDKIKQVRLNLTTATLLGGTIGAYTVVIGSAAVFTFVRQMYGPAENTHDDWSTWMVLWRIPLGSLIGSSVAAWLISRRDKIALKALIVPSLLNAFLSTCCILPLSIYALASILSLVFGS
jgi:hypothetical protein